MLAGWSGCHHDLRGEALQFHREKGSGVSRIPKGRHGKAENGEAGWADHHLHHPPPFPPSWRRSYSLAPSRLLYYHYHHLHLSHPSHWGETRRRHRPLFHAGSSTASHSPQASITSSHGVWVGMRVPDVQISAPPPPPSPRRVSPPSGARLSAPLSPHPETAQPTAWVESDAFHVQLGRVASQPKPPPWPLSDLQRASWFDWAISGRPLLGGVFCSFVLLGVGRQRTRSGREEGRRDGHVGG